MTAPPPNGDAKARYIATAINILDGHGFSLDQQAPYQPSEAAAPAYPLLIAATYTVFGRHEMAVRIVQVFLDLVSCLLVGFVAFNLAPFGQQAPAAIFAMIIYGVLSWFTAIWTADLLTETFAIALTMAAIALFIQAILSSNKRGWLWFVAGLVTGAAILTRPDSLLLAGAIGLVLLGRVAIERSWVRTRDLLGFCIAIPIVLAPWTARNYLEFEKFQPLASEYGLPQPRYIPTGYLHWIRTWITDETYFSTVFPPAFHIRAASLDSNKLPNDAFDSAAERQRVSDLISRYNQTLLFTPAISDEFDAIASERIRHSPVRFFVILPLRRAASMWLTGFAVREPTNHGGLLKILPSMSPRFLLLIRILSVLPIIIGGGLGLAWFSRRSPFLVLLWLVVLGRTVFMAYFYAPETRYIVEAYPPVIAACGVTLAVFQLSLKRVWDRTFPNGHGRTRSNRVRS
ncbi:MAG: hypothetical protein QOI77_2607 [Blastocatellia bacterium]|nr:hypothetical protein [Blastocatellia bacterium]